MALTWPQVVGCVAGAAHTSIEWVTGFGQNSLVVTAKWLVMVAPACAVIDREKAVRIYPV